MKRLIAILWIAGLLLPFAGCDAFDDVINPQEVRVSLVNNGDSDVEVTIYISDNQLVPESVLTSVGTRLDFTVPAGETTSFSRDCDDLQAIIIDDADLLVIGGVGPEANTGVLRDGTDFGCGDRIIFTFDHSWIIVDFGVTVSYES